jgi:hypothetical protein
LNGCTPENSSFITTLFYSVYGYSFVANVNKQPVETIIESVTVPDQNKYLIINIQNYTMDNGGTTVPNTNQSFNINTQLQLSNDHDPTTKTAYELYSVIVRRSGGSTESGHYVYYKYISSSNSVDESAFINNTSAFIQCNDKTISYKTGASILTDIQKYANILVYKRKN